MLCEVCGGPAPAPFWIHPEGVACESCGAAEFDRAKAAGTLGFGLSLPWDGDAA